MSNVTLPLIPISAQVQIYDIIFNIVGLHLVGFFGTIFNIFILVVVRKTKELQSPCFLLIAGECFCSIFIAAGFFVNGFEEALLLTGTISENRTRAYCYLSKTMMSAWGIQGSSLVTALISFDRLISILYPLKYRLLGKRYASVCLLFCFFYATAAVVGGFFDDKPTGFAPRDVIGCRIFFSAFTPGYFDYYGGFNLSFCVPCVLLYAVMLSTFEWRRRKINATPSSGDNNFMKQQMICMPMIKLLMSFYMITAILPEITVAIASASSLCQPYMPRMYYYGSVVKASTSLAEIIALTLGSRHFRSCAKKILRPQKSLGPAKNTSKPKYGTTIFVTRQTSTICVSERVNGL